MSFSAAVDSDQSDSRPSPSPSEKEKHRTTSNGTATNALAKAAPLLPPESNAKSTSQTSPSHAATLELSQ